MQDNFESRINGPTDGLHGIQETFRQAKQNTGEIFQRLSDKSGESIELLKERAESRLKRLRSYVEDNPLKTVLYGMTAGYLINRIFTR